MLCLFLFTLLINRQGYLFQNSTYKRRNVIIKSINVAVISESSINTNAVMKCDIGDKQALKHTHLK